MIQSKLFLLTEHIIVLTNLISIFKSLEVRCKSGRRDCSQFSGSFAWGQLSPLYFLNQLSFLSSSLWTYDYTLLQQMSKSSTSNAFMSFPSFQDPYRVFYTIQVIFPTRLMSGYYYLYCHAQLRNQEIRKLRHRKVAQLSQGHVASEPQSSEPDSNSNDHLRV